MDSLSAFHPAIRSWFERRFPLGPTEAQAQGWPTIAQGRDTLIAAPTGTGKTLTAFLVCIDRLYKEFESMGGLEDEIHLVYVSPLKALGVDIQKNLQEPLAEIADIALEFGIPAPPVRVLVRSGDTPASERVAMLKRPPHLLITTPESLYLLVTAEKSRERLRRVHTVIVDEIHAVARDKRGSHLAITLERLSALCPERPIRIGLSATQRPIETISRLLVGAGVDRSNDDGTPRCAIVDVGHRRVLDVAIEVPGSELEAVASAEQWGELLDSIAAQVEQHHTTLVFSNTRRLAERVAHLLEQRLGEGQVAAHHGSLSKQRRLKVEDRLRAGQLKVLVATASLELGIDIGPIELVCQLGTPRSIATFLQRIGRSGHQRGGTPKGRLYPMTRDELVECAALLRAVQDGRLDRVDPPVAPLDILAQQIVAACGAEDWKEDDLFELMRRAAPYAELSREHFDEIVQMLSEGILTGRGLRAAYLHRDRINGVLRGRRGARLAALTSGGAIPDTAQYRVVADPDDTFIGSVDEDWAIESMAGDIFLLGSTSWQIRRIERGVVRVRDAQGQPPTIPFWLGEAPARTAELSQEVSRLRADVEAKLVSDGKGAATSWLADEVGIVRAGAEQIVRYIAAGRAALGVVPTQKELVIERFFDETGGMQLVVHAPFGRRINRGLGLTLRKRICRSFNFEIQAAASDDAVVLSLGPQHSFSLADFTGMMRPEGVRETLTQAVLPAPMFTARWRWNLSRSLAILRRKGGKKNPPPIQRMEADDLMAAIFPTLAACQEHQTGPIEIPDHPIVRQTLDDCLSEAMDVDGLIELFEAIREKRINVHLCDTTEPSPFSHEILNGKPFTFLDNAPLEERRTRAVSVRRGLPDDVRDLARLDPDAIEKVRDEAAPSPRDANELHDLLLQQVVRRPDLRWEPWFDSLVREGRAARLATPSGSLWLAAERKFAALALFPEARTEPEISLPEPLASQPRPGSDEAAAEALRGHLDALGPVTLRQLTELTGLQPIHVEQGVARLELSGFLLRGWFEPDRAGSEQLCARRLLARIHIYTQERLRREIEPVTAQDLMRFLLRWQHVAPETRREGRRGVLAVVEQLQGFELAAGSWEEAVLPVRMAGYRPEWLDDLCLSGEVAWARLGVRDPAGDEEIDAGRGGAVPSRATPLSLAVREDLGWLLQSVRGSQVPREPGPGAARDLLETLRLRGALFFSELVTQTGRLPVEVEQGVWDLVSRGLVTADGFHSVRALLGSREAAGRGFGRRPRRRRGLRRGGRGRVGKEGRWSVLAPSVLSSNGADADAEELAEAVAEQLLARWGVVFRDLLTRENLAVSWREILWALRRMEARGIVRGGRFVTGFSGEQYALPGAVDALRRTRKLPRNGEIVRLSAVDPLNLVGIVTPGPRIPAVRTRQVVYRDGLPLQPDDFVSETPSIAGA
ncbi:MAG: DEAD/DEAH box helicase [Deltaproteobacteria bacterium]|nr:MAG: DEAD/DEAH box helicase [Deltaproteobacteria bacterium]